jgi:dTDP-4-amino-4,6-dideoxygalactose transaminase
MNIPFVDLKTQYLSIKTEINSSIQTVLDNTAYVLGPAVKEFENAFAKSHNVNYCIGTSSGTDANHLSLWSLGIGPGDEIIIPANTFIATAWGITLCGAKPVFVDCHPDSYNIDPELVESVVTKNTKGIVAVHLYGQPADMDSLSEICDRFDLYLVEDAAQAHLAEYKGNKIGGLSDVASFSFYPGKNLGAYGEAGALTTNNEELAEKIQMMRDHGMKQKYYHDCEGHNYRMEGIQGAVLKTKMNYISGWTEKRITVAERYRALLDDVEEISLPFTMPYAKHVFHLFVIKVLKDGSKTRDDLAEFLKEKGIATGMHYPIPLHLQRCFSHLKYSEGNFPVSEELASCGLSLPIYPELNDDQISYICDMIKEFFAR